MEKLSSIKETNILTKESVDHISDLIGDSLSSIGKSRRDVLQIRYRMEDLILDVCERFEEKITYTLEIGERFRRPFIRFTYQGESFNPMDDSDDSVISQNWSNKLMADSGLSPTWVYRNDKNIIQLNLERRSLGMFASVILAFALALTIGFLGMFISSDIKNAIAEYFLKPVQSIYLGILSTFAGLMIFFSIVCGIFEMGDMSFFSKIGKMMIGRFLRNILLFSIFYCGLAFLFFPLNYSGGMRHGGSSSQIVDMFTNMFPTNVVDPFLTGNTMQIVLLGVVIGILILVIGESGSKTVRAFASEFNSITQKAIGWICKFVPVLIFVTFIQIIWEGNLSTVAGIWKLLLFAISVSIIGLAFVIIKVSITKKVPLGLLLKKLFPTFFLSASTASSAAAFSLSIENGEKLLGIDRRLLGVALPIGNVIYMGAVPAECIGVSFYMANTYGVKVNIVWVLLAIILAFVLTVAVPPMPGAGVTILGALFLQLGLPIEGMVVAIAFELLYDFFCTGADNAFILVELINQGDKSDMLDLEVLRKKM